MMIEQNIKKILLILIKKIIFKHFCKVNFFYFGWRNVGVAPQSSLNFQTLGQRRHLMIEKLPKHVHLNSFEKS